MWRALSLKCRPSREQPENRQRRGPAEGLRDADREDKVREGAIVLGFEGYAVYGFTGFGHADFHVQGVGLSSDLLTRAFELQVVGRAIRSKTPGLVPYFNNLCVQGTREYLVGTLSPSRATGL